MKKIISLVLCLCVLLSGAVITVNAENEKISPEIEKKISENSDILIPVYIFLQVDFNKSEVEKYVLDNFEDAKTDADIFLKYYRAEVKNIISPQVQKFVDDNKNYLENIRFQSDSTGLVIADVYAYNIEKIAQYNNVTDISYYDDSVKPAPANSWLYEDKFTEQYNIDKEKIDPNEYSYSELYYHTNSEGEIDWVLIDAYYGAQCDVEVAELIGNVYLHSGGLHSPFDLRYGIYDVKEDKFYDILDYKNIPEKLDELVAVLKKLKIGEEVDDDLDPFFTSLPALVRDYYNDNNILYDDIKLEYHFELNKNYYDYDVFAARFTVKGYSYPDVMTEAQLGDYTLYTSEPQPVIVHLGNKKIYSFEDAYKQGIINDADLEKISGYDLIGLTKNSNPTSEPATSEPAATNPTSAYDENSKFYSQEFCDALTDYLKDLDTNHLYIWSDFDKFTVDSLKIKDSIITLYEETEDMVIFNIKGAMAAPGEDIINGYKFTTPSYFGAGSKNETDCGHCVYKDGKIYGIIKAVKNGIVTVEHLAQVIPNVQKIESNEPASVEPVTEPAQPSTSKPAVNSKKDKPLKLSAKAKTIKAKKLKKKKQTVKPLLIIKNAVGKVTVTKVKKGTTSKIFKKITVNKKTGAITFKKGKYNKKTYKVKLKISVKGNSKYADKILYKTVKIKII